MPQLSPNIDQKRGILVNNQGDLIVQDSFHEQGPLHARLLKLERENRIFKAVALLGVSLLLTGQSPQPNPDEQNSRRIPPYLGKPSGKSSNPKPAVPAAGPKATKINSADVGSDITEISAERITTKKLRIVDDQGRPRVNVFTAGSDVYLMMGESSGRSRLALKVEESGASSVILAGSDGEPKASWQCAADGTIRRTP
jgi:hypothetical protein